MHSAHAHLLNDPDALLATTHGVAGGLRVRLRLTRPSDSSEVREFLEDLSSETRRRRFLVATPEIGHPLVRHFTCYDPRQRLVVAANGPIGNDERIVGLADVVLLSTGLAEFAVVVADEWQGRGLGTLLTAAIASLAARQGATHLRAELLKENAATLRLMERLGPTVRTLEDGSAVAYTKLPAGGRPGA